MKDIKDKLKNLYKNKNVVIATWVFVLTLFSIGFSYSAFFTVKSNTNNQTVKTGNLSVSYGNGTSSITKTNMIGLSDETGMAEGDVSVIYIQNDGTLASNYVLTLGYDMASFRARSDYKDTDILTPVDYIKFAVYEYNSATGGTLIAGPLTLADLPIYKYDASDSRNIRYSVLFDTLGVTSNNTKTYQVKMWLSDKATPVATNSYFYVNSEIVAEADNTKMAYNFTGKVLKSNTAVSGAKVSLHNGSRTFTTNANGEFTVTGLIPGVYNLDIIESDQTHKGTLTVKEGIKGISRPGYDGFTISSNMTLYEAAYTYGSTINKVMTANAIKGTSSNMLPAGEYYVDESFALSGGSNADLGTVTITVQDGYISDMKLS